MAQGLYRDRSNADEQNDSVGESRQDRASSVAVGPCTRRVTAAEPGGAPGEQQPEDVAKIVCGISEKRDGIRRDPEDHLSKWRTLD